MGHGPPIIFIMTSVVVIGLPLFGLGWLIFKRCKFSMGQLMFCLFVYGTALSAVSFLKLERDKQIGLSIASAIAVLLFQFFGARMAARANPRKRLKHWIFFLGGFFVLPSGFGVLAALIGLLSPNLPNTLLSLLALGFCGTNVYFVMSASGLPKFDERESLE